MPLRYIAAFYALAYSVVALRASRHATQVRRLDANSTKYDFVIVGGGLTGLTVADRLTEDPSVRVLVIEAGPFDEGQRAVLVPGAFDQSEIPYYWNLTSEPQTSLGNRSFSVPMGKAVGGGTVGNAMVFFRAAKGDYDSWEALGATSLAYDTLLPYMKKSESFTAPEQSFAEKGNVSWDESNHGSTGPVQISYPNYFYPGSANWWNAALETGFDSAADINNGNPIGISWFTTTVNATSRTRSDARINHYDIVAKTRPNYHILADHTVTKIILEGNKTVGVDYQPTAGGNSSQIHATKEVLLGAGAIQTTKLLQLSGIGPRSLLESLSIAVVSDLPGVGANLQDQPNGVVPYTFQDQINPNADDLISNATFDTEQEDLYYAKREGAWTITRSFGETVALFSLCDATADCQGMIATAREEDPAALLPAGTDATVVAGYKAQREQVLEQYAGDNVPIGMIHWTTGGEAIVWLQRPLSRGLVQIQSNNALDNPLVDYRTLTDPVDLDIAVANVLKNRQIMQAPSMAVLGPSESYPYGNNITDKDQLKSIITSNFGPTTGHVCCTAAMVPLDKGGVVDTEWKVYGISSLRVIDISTLPMISSSTPMATLYGMAEKIADVIKETYTTA
ncbi:Dehydrogenase xptC [Lachnellula suecica]|uniref:Dehydrogenase xptC n=1 Tax=Lachnellula suecica TaxID=602035 RepID=A0A8T9CFW5_9HELO|nr:Dehydrogenase xptC [Lachnellula suecica]